MKRKEYTMKMADYDKFTEASLPMPVMAIGNFTFPTTQENINRAWENLGNKMGFDGTTALSSEQNPLNFTAIPNDIKTLTEEQVET